MKVNFFATLLLLACVMAVPSGAVYAASNSNTSSWFTESGVVVGYGSGNIPEGTYEPILLIWHLSKDLSPYLSSLKGHQGTLSFICEPQVNPAFSPKTDIEFGVGLGLKYMYPITDKISPYVFGSVGPHYISVQTEDQANGFIFADTVGAGLYFKITKNPAINIGYRYRHVSNARLKSPNGGINVQFGTIGYSVFF